MRGQYEDCTTCQCPNGRCPYGFSDHEPHMSKREVKHKDMLGLKALWERVMHWYGLANNSKILPWKRKQSRANAETCWDNFETAGDKILQDVIVTTGPEIESQKYRDKPPGRGGRKESA